MRRFDAMNPVVEEMKAILEGDKETLAHYGMPRRSGRYPWGSGDDPYQRTRDFLGRYESLKNEGKSERQISEAMGILNDKGEPSTTRLRAQKTLATNERKMLNYETAKRLREKERLGYTEIARRMGLKNESSVRSLLNEDSQARRNKAIEIADVIETEINKKGMIDVGADVHRELGISKEKFDQAIEILQEKGYPVYKGGIPQVTNKGQQTNQKVICPPGTEHKEIYNFDKIHTLNEYTSKDGGETISKFVYPKSMDSKRLMIRYAEEGGLEKDGIVELRRGVDDLSLGDARYSQVRILVDNKKYIKGMAVYADDMPDGIDVIFNTNKKAGTPKLDVLKDIKNDPDNPFGSLIKSQSEYIDKNGKKQLSLINKRADEGDWSDWKDALPSQFLAKQSLSMIKKQLNIAKTDKYAEYDEICSLNNPTLKKHYLKKFADECDAAAVHLKAAALPGQKYHVIIPINSLKDDEIYAPNYENGTKLALVRYPHGGTFEIPILTVNNKHAAARKLLGPDVGDAVGITAKNAERLSGADFDGDTVMCIPTHDRGGKVKVISTPELDGLKGFDPKFKYSSDEVKTDADGTKHYYRNGREYRIMKNTNTQMGVISNLISDMTLAGAGPEDLAKAVRHSMVVIDAEKHKLDYRQSEIDNDIASLHKAYQGKSTGGASTIISRAKGEKQVLKRQGSPKINVKGKEWYDPTKPEGAYIYKTADDLEYTVKKINKRTGEVTEKVMQRHQKSTKMAEADDAMSLVSDAKHPKELEYADYANSMKALANKARLEMLSTGKIEYSKSANTTYKNEVNSLMDKLNTAKLNTIKERAAQRKANYEVSVKTQAYKEETGTKMKPKDEKKLSQQALTRARDEVGSISRRERSIKITEKEWEAIQAGAISEHKLKQILDNTDVDNLRERAMPRSATTLRPAQANRIKALSASYTLSQIAEMLGVSTSTVSKYLKGAV